MIYPLAVIVAFAAFAFPYNQLGERWQSYLPAAASITLLVALMATVYTVVAFTWPRRGLVAGVTLITGLALLNGNAWFTAPNQFKTRFPHLDQYYKRPIYLDSRSYFRETTPSTVRLRNKELTESDDLLENQSESERLATAYFQLKVRAAAPGRGQALVFKVKDIRNRLRARVGDELRLIAEDCFSSVVQNNDCRIKIREPFFQKISQAFDYDRLHFVQNGLSRGEVVRLSHGEIKKNGRTPYTFFGAPGQDYGLTLHGLSSDPRARAGTVMIATSWVGRVTSVTPGPSHTSYEVAFPTPVGRASLEGPELSAMNVWLETCHLDLVRQSVGLKGPQAGGDTQAMIDALGAQTGDCVVLEDDRGENRLPLALFLPLPTKGIDTKRYPDLSGFWLTPENVTKECIPETYDRVGRPDEAKGEKPSFSLRLAHDRGLLLIKSSDIASNVQPVWDVALYNAGRVRLGERLILRWYGRDGSAVGGGPADGGIFEVQRLGTVADEPVPGELPRGYRRAKLRLMASSRTPADARSALDLKQARCCPCLLSQRLLVGVRTTIVGAVWSQFYAV